MNTIKKGVVLKAIQAAIDRAKSKSPTTNYAQGKAYELKVLALIISKLRQVGHYTISCKPKTNTHLTFGGAPCAPNSSGHDCIRVTNGLKSYELWVSVQFTTLSYDLGKTGAAPICSDLHEIDIGLYKPLTGSAYPSYVQLVFAASCKAGAWSKLHVREALGLRRELGRLAKPKASSAPWFAPVVPCDPPIPLALFAADMNSIKYQGSLASLGLFVVNYL
jgi:hypothetical protein